MKAYRWLLLLTALCLIGCFAPVRAGWGPGACSATAPVGAQAQFTGWVKCNDGATWAWFVQGQQAGWYDPARHVWRDCSFGVYGAEKSPPWERPFADPAIPNYGLESDKIGVNGERYRINGRDVSSKEAKRIIGGTDLKDDSSKPRFTVIGPDADRQRVLADLQTHPALAQYKDQWVVQDYPADHWAVKNVGFAVGGRPSIYLQSPSGKVILRRDSYEGGAEELAQALRRTDPKYDPAKDPSGKPQPLDPSDWPPEGIAAAILAAIAGLKKMLGV